MPELLVRPAFLWTPPHTGTWGPDAVDLAASVGLQLDGEQRLVLDALLARNGGVWAALEAAIVEARQNGKTGGVLLPAALADLFLFGARLIIWSAHLFETAQEAFRAFDELVTNWDHLRREVKRVTRGNGEEGIELNSGARLKFRARSRTGGRGLSGDRVVLDEAFALAAAHMGALFPTLSARPDPQVMYGSSAGLADSEILRGIRDRGRPGGDPSLAYAEYAADTGDCATAKCDHSFGNAGCLLDDVDRWRAANHTLGRRISVEYVAAERRALPPAEFARERLGWWDEVSGTRVISAGTWAATFDEDSTIVGRVAFGVAVAIDQSSASISAAGRREDGLEHLEVLRAGRGTSWVAPALALLVAKWSPAAVVVDSGGPTGTIVADIEAADVELTKVTGRVYAQACGALFNALIGMDENGASTAPTARHIGQDELDSAVAGARWRSVGDLRAWDRRDTSIDISPLESVTLARHGLTAIEDQDITTSVW